MYIVIQAILLLDKKPITYLSEKFNNTTLIYDTMEKIVLIYAILLQDKKPITCVALAFFFTYDGKNSGRSTK